ncbi:MAG: TIGR02677 family protein [Jiangellaceae bacterium]
MPYDFKPFGHLTTPNAALYRRVMGVFVDAKRRFAVHLRPEDVREALITGGDEPLDVADLTELLNKLSSDEWGNLRADPDTGRVTTVEDFHRARFLYQLTKRGEAAEEALQAYDDALGRRGALQAVALVDIASELRSLLGLTDGDEPDPAKAHLSLRGLTGRFTDLADNAQAFMSSLQRSIDLHDADAEAFVAYKDRLIDYLERFVKDLVATGSEIATLVERIEQSGVDRLLAGAARREAEDAAPDAAPGTGDDPRKVAFDRALTLWQQRWQGFRQWFVSAPHHPSQAKLLRARARAAIPQLLQVVSTLNERRTGRSDRSADFRALARWFAQAPDDAAMHRLWRSAFGLQPSRHLTIPAATLAERDEHPVGPSIPWAQAPPLSISPQLRRTGSYERRGKPNRVLDRSEARRHLAELVAKEAAQTAEARRRLATARPIRLAELDQLDPATFALFLRLLGDALTARRPDQRQVVATTADGTMEIRMTSLGDGTLAEIRTTEGILRGPDHLVEILDLTDVDDVEVAS